MNFDYEYGNNLYKYYGATGIKSTVYNILAPEQQQKKTARDGILDESSTYFL